MHLVCLYWLSLALVHSVGDVVLVWRSRFGRNVRCSSLDWPRGGLRWESELSVLFHRWLGGNLFLEAGAFPLGQFFEQTLPELVQNALFGDDESDCFDYVLFPLGSGSVVSVNERILVQGER